MIFHLRIFALSAIMLVASWLTPAQTAGQAQAPSQSSPEAAASPAPAASPVPADSAHLEVVKAPQPDYPLEAAAAGIEGRVWIELHISENGDVDRTEIMGGDPLLAKAAESAMKQWKFKPFIKDGKPVRISRKVPFDFVLKGKPGAPCAAVEAILATNHGNDVLPPEVMKGALIHKVDPAYPQIARIKRVQGKVILLATIGDDGRIHQVKALCGPPELVPASIEAVRQWRYRPYMSDGNPIAVETTIKVEFHM